MNFPRRLSPVRTVEAETGWPRALCRRFVLGSEMDWLILVWFFWAVLMALPTLVGLPVLLVVSGPDPLNTAAALGLLIAVAASGAFVAGLALSVTEGRAARVRRTLPRFLSAPWCLKCRYPVPAAAGRAEHGAAVCPECGEPIPREIARLAAERGARRRSSGPSAGAGEGGREGGASGAGVHAAGAAVFPRPDPGPAGARLGSTAAWHPGSGGGV